MAGGIIAVLTLCEAWVMYAVVAVTGTIAAFEYHSMAAPSSPLWGRLVFLICALGVGLQPLIEMGITWSGQTAFTAAFGLIALKHLFTPIPLDGVTDRFAKDALGIVYMGCTLPYILELRGLPDNQTLFAPELGGWLLLLVIVTTALSDTGGYFFGRAFGKHKLFEAVSPKKTIEGALGGLICAVGGCFAMQAAFPTMKSLSAVDCIALGVLITASSIIGDLVESLLKRGYGVKDSGTLIPGHGGVLDRVDALLFSAPAVYFYWRCFVA